jgi:hypothetical protein
MNLSSLSDVADFLYRCTGAGQFFHAFQVPIASGKKSTCMLSIT